MCYWTEQGVELSSQEKQVLEAEREFENFGQETDEEVARNLGVSLHTVQHEKQELTKMREI